jgi:amino-acid N-acetyltransferase
MHAKIRPAVVSDVDAILTILSPYAKEGLILERTAAEIKHAISTFFVAENSGSVTGTVSYHDYGKHLKEVRSLAVRRERAGRRTGSLLVRHLVRSLQERVPGTRIFVLTYAPLFFQKLGFAEVPKESLPEKIWKDCDHCKNRDNCGETALVYQGPHGEVEQ